MSWKTVALGDYYRVASSKRVLKSEWQTEGVPFYRGREISALSKQGYVENELYITKEMYEKYAKTYGVPSADDIMITAIGTIGNTYIVKDTDKFYFKDASVLWLSKEKEINERFVNYWFKSSFFFNQLSVGLGATVDTLTISKVQSLLINLPSLATQKKIVEKLDAIFAEIDTATVATEANVKNAEALFQSYLTEVFDSINTSKLYKLDDVVTRLTNGYVGATKNIYLESGIPYLLARHVKNNVLTFDERTFISDEFNKKNKKSILKTDDVLLVQSGHIGHSAVVPSKHEGHNCHAMIVITTIKEILSGEFLSLYFQSNKMKILFEEMRTGSTIKHLNCGDVKLLLIPIPSCEEQKNIIAKAKDIGTLVSSVKEIMLVKSVQLELLRKAVLTSAFSGELVKE